MIRLIITCLALLSITNPCWSDVAGQDELKKLSPKGGEPGWQPPHKKSFSTAERSKECAKYKRTYIGYYGKVYWVEGCKRYLLDRDQVKKIMKSGVRVHEVKPDTIVKIASGGHYKGVRKNRDCKKLNNRYVLSVGGDMYLVKGCKKYRFPDWDTYIEHSKKRKDSHVYEMSEKEFYSLKTGRVFPSILDKELNAQSAIEEEVDVIPLSEACAGIDGKYMSYYSKVYRIENCRKREIKDPSKYLNKLRRVKELSSEQWISLPNGEALTKL